MPLTAEEFNKLTTKDDLKEFEKRMEGKFAGKDDMNKVIGMLDGIAKGIKDHNDEHIANQGAHDRFEERIEVLEKKTGVSQA